MRRAALILAVMAVATVAGGGLALAATITGTGNDETLTGTGFADTIRARGGDDAVYGLRGPDRLYGGSGHDRLNGGRGDDVIHADDLAGPGPFPEGQRDVVYCGPGHDLVYRDDKDAKPRGCEEVVFVTA